MGFIINDSYPYLEELDAPIDIFLTPYPNGMWQQNNSYPYLPLDANELIDVFLEPLPNGIYTQKKGEYPKYDSLELVRMGAFCYASNLEKVTIPKSVKYIGEWAFTYTKLKEVTIAADCVYYPTSFPHNCIIHYYDEN